MNDKYLLILGYRNAIDNCTIYKGTGQISITSSNNNDSPHDTGTIDRYILKRRTFFFGLFKGQATLEFKDLKEELSKTEFKDLLDYAQEKDNQLYEIYMTEKEEITREEILKQIGHYQPEHHD